MSMSSLKKCHLQMAVHFAEINKYIVNTLGSAFVTHDQDWRIIL